jgi:hypothetical protein
MRQFKNDEQPKCNRTIQCVDKFWVLLSYKGLRKVENFLMKIFVTFFL